MLSELDRLLRQTSELLGCEEVSFRCWLPGLEVVYVERDGDELVITDRGETYQYLDGGDDFTYDIALLDEATARAICQRYGVELDTSDPELYPRIQRKLTPADDIPAVLSAVGEAIDRVNNAARRPDLRWPPDTASPAASTG
jgi:hypothetical protein